MTRQILLEKRDEKILLFVVEEGRIAEIHVSVPEERGAPHLGDIYIGRVQNLVESIGAAFVEIQKGILCYLDLSEVSCAVFTKKQGKKPLCIGDELVVQVSREAVKTKAPTVTCRLNFTGKYAVLTHGNTRLGVSSKLSKTLREEYREKLKTQENASYGLIVRTNAKDVSFDEVEKEICALKKEYESILQTALFRVRFSCLKSAPPSFLSDLKTIYLQGVEEILTEDRELFETMNGWFSDQFPSALSPIRLYEDPLGYPLSKLYSLDTVLEKALREKVWLRHGGYLVIQPTEALTVVDVNSGKNTGKGREETGILKINLEAAVETARQIRLRNLSGIILIDFINLEEKENIDRLMKEFRWELSKDPVQTTLVDMTKLGLVEVTRKKTKKPLHEVFGHLQDRSYEL